MILTSTVATNIKKIGRSRNSGLNIPRCAAKEMKYLDGKILSTVEDYDSVNACALNCDNIRACRYWMIYFPEKAITGQDSIGTIGACIMIADSPNIKLDDSEGWISGITGCYNTDLEIPRCAKIDEKYVKGNIIRLTEGIKTVNDCAKQCDYKV